MNINYRKIKSFGYKLFVSVLCAFILVFSYEVNKPKAIAPLIVWGGSLLAGVLVEEAVEMGIRSFTAEGKATKKAKTVKLGKEISKEIAEYGFDLMKDKPTKKADGSLVIKPSANDRAKLAKKIADEFGEVIEWDGQNQAKWSKPKFKVDAGEFDPFYNTSVEFDVYPKTTTQYDMKAYDYLIRLYDIKLTPIAFAQKTRMEIYSNVTGKRVMQKEVNGGFKYYLATYNYNQSTGNFTIDVPDFTSTGGSNGKTVLSPSPTPVIEGKLYNQYIFAMEQANSQIFFGKGLAVPKTIQNVYPAPKHLPSDFELPNKDKLSNKPIIIENMFPPSDSDVEISWEDIDKNYYQGNESEWNQKLEQYIDNRIEYGDIVNSNNNDYTYNIINNYYTDITYEVKADEVEEKLPAPPKGDDGDLPAEGGGTADPLDRSMLSYIRESYEYLGDSIDNNLKVMKDVVDDAGGVVDFLDESFDWLPAEWRAYFGAAFILGVVAHFFRR